MKKLSLLLLAGLLLGAFLAACNTAPEAEEENVKTIYVGPELVDCVGVAPQQCLQVKENPEDEYTLFYDTIEGFNFEEGYEYELRVREETVENPPADASSVKWTLVEEVSKTPVETPRTGAEGEQTDTTANAPVIAAGDGGEIKTLYVGPEMAECVGVAPQMCLLVRENPEDEYTFFYDNIEGFEYEEGFNYTLQVRVEQVENPPADASSLKYTLVEVVEKTPAEVTLESTPWSLDAYVDLDGNLVDVAPGTEITAVFESNRVAGSAGCNNYFAEYQVDGSALTMGVIGATNMFCDPDSLMLQEASYLAALQGVAAYTIVDGQLQLANAAGEPVLYYSHAEQTPLTETAWQVTFYNNGLDALVSVLAGTEMTAVFSEDGGLSGLAGCNNFMSSYTLDGTSIAIQPPAATRKLCGEPQGIMEQETAYLAALSTAASYEIMGDELILYDAEGARAVTFVAEQTAVSDELLFALANATYQSDFTESGSVTLTNGVYRAPIVEDAASELIVELTEHIAAGTLADGQEALAVILTTQSGGTGAFFDLAVIVQQEDQLVNVAKTQLGDRVVINDLAIENGEIRVDMVTQGPDDPMCCPTQQVMETYALQDGELVQTSSEVIEGMAPAEESASDAALALSPDAVSLDLQGLASTFEWVLVPATPYDNTQPPGPTGAPRHLAITFDGEEPSGAASQIRIYPVDAYRALWEDAGDNTITDLISRLETLLAERPALVENPIPVVPPQVGFNDFAVQTQFLDSAGGSGLRFVGRFAQSLNPVLNSDLYYYFQGLSSDGRYLISARFPVDTALLPNSVDEITDDVQAQFEQDSEAYLQGVRNTLNDLSPADWTPDLSQLDALVTSIQIDAPGRTAVEAEVAPELVGTVWKWVATQTPVEQIEVPEPEKYTLQFNEDGTVNVVADCNTGMGPYTLDNNALEIGPLATTRALCPPESLSDRFVQDLQFARIFFFQEGNLYMDLMADGGTMQFVP